VRSVNAQRSGRVSLGDVAPVAGALAAIVTAWVAVWLQPSAHAFSLPSQLVAIAAVTLAGAAIAMLARSARLADAEQQGALLNRAIAERRKSDGAAFQRQRDPDAAGRARPRAPAAAPAAA
jgi:hypothetical protein